MASRHVGHPLKLNTQLLALTERLYRTKWHIPSCRWYATLGTLHTKTNYLLANLSFPRGAEGDGATSHSCASTKGSIEASSSSLEAQMARCFMQLVCKVGHFTHRKKLPACESFIVHGAKGDGQTYPSFTTENGLIDASSLSLEAPIATHHMWGGCKLEQFHNGKQIPVCRSFVV